MADKGDDQPPIPTVPSPSVIPGPAQETPSTNIVNPSAGGDKGDDQPPIPTVPSPSVIPGPAQETTSTNIVNPFAGHHLASSSAAASFIPIHPPHPRASFSYPPFSILNSLLGAPRNVTTITPPRRQRRGRDRAPAPEEPAIIPPPYPWSSDRRCKVHSLRYLHSQDIVEISGDVHCNKCERTYEIRHNLRKKFDELTDFVYEHVDEMRHRAHPMWMNPVPTDCVLCKERQSVIPVIAEQEQNINWLFLLLGQMLGLLSVEQLRYFCTHTGNVLTGAKRAILFRVYMDLCRQVDPFEAFYH